MHTIFNFSSFLKLVKTETYSFRKIYLYIAIALLAYFAIHIWQIDQGLRLSYIIYPFNQVSILCIIIVPFIFYGKLYDKVQGVDYAMLPANASEKFAAALVQCALIVPAFTVAITLIGTYGTALIYNFEVSNLFANFGENYLDAIAGQSLAFWACFWFRKNKIRNLILTLCALVFIGFLISTLSMALYTQIYRDIVQTNFIEYFILPFFNNAHTYSFLIFPLALWLLSFCKLTRQQI